MTINLLKNPTFCVLPFIEQHQALDGKQYLCCHSATPLDAVGTGSRYQLIEQIQAEQKIPHCIACYQQDSQKIISPRLRESARWLKDSDVKNYITNWTANSPQQTFFYDIRFENKCNLACISCDAISSSLWARELGIQIPTHDLLLDTDRILACKKIYLAGGEPLIIDQFIQLIDQISKANDQPELVINTNLTSLGDQVIHSLQCIKNLTMVVSVDAYGRVNDYHRWPSKWDKFMLNLQQLRDKVNCTIQFNTVIDAVTVINASQLVNIEYIADQWNLSILSRPNALVVNNLPTKHKQKIVSSFEQIKQSRFYSNDITFKSQVDGILYKINTPGDPELLSMYISGIDQRRNIKHKHYLELELT